MNHSRRRDLTTIVCGISDLLMALASRALGREAKRMDPSTEKAAWKHRTLKKTTSRILSEEQVRQSRRSDLTKETTRHISRHASLARQRYDDKFGDAAWDETEKDDAAAWKERKKIQQRRRRHREALASVTEKINSFREEASKGTLAQNAAFLRDLANARKNRRNIISKLQSEDTLGPKPTETHGKIGSSSCPGIDSEMRHSRTVRLASHSTTAAPHVLHGSVRERGHAQLPVTVTKSNLTLLGHSSIQRTRATQSDNTFLLKRTRGGENLTRNIRTLSDPISRKIQFNHYGGVTRGSDKVVRFWKQSSPALEKISPPTNGRAGAELFKPLPRTKSRNQDGKLSTTKRLRSLPHYSGVRPPEQLFRPSNEANNSQISGESLRNDEGKKGRSSREPEQLATNLSWRPHLSAGHTTANDKPGPLDGCKTTTPPETTWTKCGTGKTEVREEKRQVRIPADTTMATDLRAYSQWPGTLPCRNAHVAIVEARLITLYR